MKPRAKKNLKKRSKAHIKRGVKVTKAKRTGDELSERDTVLRRLHETVPAGIVFVDRNGQITFANARAMQVLGLKRSELAKRTYNDPAWRITTHDGRPLSDKDLPFQRVKAAGKPVFDVRHAILRPDGQRVLLSINAAPLSDRSGKFGGMVAVVTDITRYVGAVEMLRESEGRYRQLLEASMDAVSVTVGTKFVYVNKRCAELLGFSDPSQLIGRDFTEFVAPEDREMVLARTLAREIGERQPPLYEFKIQRRDGTKVPVETNATAIEYEGKKAVLSFRRDITERKLAEQKLRLQGEIAENMFEGVVLTRASNGVIVYVNRRFEEMFGYGSGELIEKNIATVNAPEEDRSPEDVAREIQANLREHGVWSGEVRNIKKDGTPFWCRANVSTLESPEYGAIWVATHEDITERKKMEVAVRKSEERFRSVFNNAHVGIALDDMNGHVLAANDAECRFLGYSQEEIVGMHFKEFTYPEDLDEDTELFEELMKGKRTNYTIDKRFIRKTGEIVSGRLQVSLIREIDGSHRHAIVICEDITERKKMEDELRRSEERFRKIFQSSPIPATITLLEGPIVDVNDAWVRMSGYSREEVIGHSTIELGMMPDPGQRDRILKDLLEKGRLSNVEITRRTKSGELRDLLNTLELVELDGQKCILNMQVDITERKRAEEEIRSLARFPLENPNPVLRLSEDGVVLDANPASEPLLRGWECRIGGEAPKTWRDLVAEVLEGQSSRSVDVELGGKVYLFTVVPVKNADYVNVYGRDITDRKKMEESLRETNIQQATLAVILERFVHSTDLKEFLEESVRTIKDYTQCSSVGIRLLDDHGNIPYEAYVGFPTEFYESESPLSVKSDKCMCINVIKGDYDPSEPFFTANGSFYTNGTSKLLATVSEEERGETRNVCNRFGYESVSLTPIRLRDRILGLIHVADEKENMVPLEKVQFMEKIAAEVALAIEKAWITTKLKESEEKLNEYSKHLEKMVEEKTRALKESEERFRALFECAPLPYQSLNDDGCFIEVNQTWLDMLGYSREEVIGRWFGDFLSPPYVERFKQNFPRFKAAGEINDIEFEMVKKDGSSLTASYAGRIGYDEHGNFKQTHCIFQDITERKRVEEEIRRLSEFRKQLLENMTDAVAVINPRDHTFIAINRAGLQPMGRKERDVIGKVCYELTDCDLWPDTCPISEVARTGKPATIERIYQDHKGVRRCFDNQYSPLKDEEGNVAEVVLVARDITEKKMMSTRLIESEEKFRGIAENSFDLIFTTNTEGYLTYVSRSAERIFNYAPEELVGKQLWEWIPKSEIPKLDRMIQAMKGESVEMLEIEMPKKDGSLITVEINASAIHEDGKVVGLQGIVRDISERKRILQSLAYSEGRYRALFDNASDALITADLEGRILETNRKACETFGYSSEELTHKAIRDLVSPDKLDVLSKQMRELVEGGRASFEFTFTRPDGSVVYLDLNCRIIEYRGEIAVLGIARDITERMQIEKMRNQFISAVTHELRTPLVSVTGYLDLILSGREGAVSKEAEANLLVVKRNADRLLSLTNDLLDVQRLQSGRLQLSIEPMDFKEVVESCIAEARPLIDERKLRLRVEVPEGVLLVEGDKVRLCQVVMNLLSNASKFSPEGGDVALRVEEEKERIKVQVSDKGIGIRKENLERVFEPFAAIQKPTYVKGTGLGLSITKGIVEAHGGKVWAESPGEGKGATFIFTLPKRKKPSTEDARKAWLEAFEASARGGRKLKGATGVWLRYG